MSATNLQGVYLDAADRPLMERFRAQRPLARIGYSIFIYRAGLLLAASPMTPARASCSAGLALSAGSVAGRFLLVGEAGLRLLGVTPRALPDDRADGQRPLDAAPRLLPHEPAGLLRHRPAAAREPRERYLNVAPLRFDDVARGAPWAVEFRYNALRFRDEPLGPKPEGVRRVMVLGDSFTEGQGVKADDTA